MPDIALLSCSELVPFNIGAGIATRRHTDTLRDTLTQLASQARPPSGRVVCCIGPANVAGPEGHPGIEFLVAPSSGLPAQCNAILYRPGGGDALLFLNDDLLTAPGTSRRRSRSGRPIRPSSLPSATSLRTAQRVRDSIRQPRVR